MLAGEYAVLLGAPAIGAAVQPRAVVEIRSAESALSSVVAPGFVEGKHEFRFDADGSLVWKKSESAKIFSLLQFALKNKGFGAAITKLAPLHFILDTSAFRDGTRKLGLGSSAALTVALIGALAAATGGNYVPDIAHAVHSSIQGGRGSGADIEISASGGVCLIQRNADTIAVEPLVWPESLLLIAVDTGRAASTPAMLARLQRWQREVGEAGGLSELSNASRAAANAWREGSSEVVLQALQNFSVALQRLDAESGIGIFSGGHTELAEMAATTDVVYKPSGAGGGDLGIGFATSVAVLAEFEARILRAGFRIVTTAVESTGLSIQ